MAANNRCHTPLLDQREKRTNTLFALPKNLWQIAPRRSGLGVLENRFDEESVVSSAPIRVSRLTQ